MHIFTLTPVVDVSDKFKIPLYVPSGFGTVKIIEIVMAGVHGNGPTKQSVVCHFKNAE